MELKLKTGEILNGTPDEFVIFIKLREHPLQCIYTDFGKIREELDNL